MGNVELERRAIEHLVALEVPMADGAAPQHGAGFFTESAERVVSFLNANTPLPDWSVSRLAAGEQVHLHVRELEHVLAVGNRVDWNESFCSRMAAGAAHVVPDARADPDYADLDAASQVGAYAGFTIGDDREGAFGVLCGVRQDPLRETEHVDADLVRLLSELLTTQLRLARMFDRERRQLELTEALAQTDALTGVLNRRGWDQLVRDAQERLDAFGDPVAVAVIDLDGLKAVNDTAGHHAGDALLQRAAAALRSACTPASHVARFGGDEFMVLLGGATPANAGERCAPFAAALAAAGVPASVGVAAAQPGIVPLDAAIAKADAAMYAEKRLHKAIR